MLERLKAIRELLVGRPPEEQAALAAYVIAPTLVFGLAVGGVYTPGLGLDFARPMTVALLGSYVDSQGHITSREGLALVIEPDSLEYQIPVSSPSGLWVSLDEGTLRANADHLRLSESGLRGRSPLMGVSSPVTVVVEGTPSDEMRVPGGSEHLTGWENQARRSTSLISSVLLACVFAFGVSVATGFPSAKRNQDTARKERAKPDEH